MKIQIETENCDLNKFCDIKGNASSIIKLSLFISNVISSQSRKILVKELICSIQEKLESFKWLIIGEISIEYVWYLNAVERQE